MIRFVVLLILPLLTSSAAAQGYLNTASRSPRSLPPLTLEQVQSMDHDQMRNEMIRRGMAPQYADQAAEFMQGQVQDFPTFAGPDSQLDDSNILNVEEQLPVSVELPRDADVSYLYAVRYASRQRISILDKELRTDDARFGILNATDLNGALGLHNAIRHQNQHYVSRPRNFSIYGITRTNILFSVQLGFGAGDLNHGRRFNVAAFRIGRKHLPVKLYVRDGGDLGWPMTSLGPGSGHRRPGSKPALLRDYLEKHAELVLTYERQSTGQTEISICFQQPSQKYVWVDASTLKPRGARATW